MIIAVKDDDHPFTDDSIDRIVIQRRMTPGQSERSSFSGQHIGDFRMDVTVTVQCDPNFYGSNCSIACVPRNDSQGHYTCNSNGQKVCNAGWIDPFYSCTTRKLQTLINSLLCVLLCKCCFPWCICAAVCDAPCVQGTCTGPNICR